MILDSQNLFSDDQAITATAVSTNVLDLRPVGQPVKGNTALIRDIGPGKPIPLLIQVTEAFDNLTSLEVTVQTSTDEAFTSPVDGISQTLLLADLTAGRQFDISYVPNHTELAFMRLNYTVVGTTPTVGQVTAGITAGNDTNNNTY